MAQRKPIEDDCNGGIFCPVKGHVKVLVFASTPLGARRTRTSHIPLTAGQSKTLRERRADQRKQQS